MISKSRKLLTISLAGAALMAAGCGGNSDDGAGSPTAFSVVPDEFTVTSTGGAGTCPAAGSSVDVFVFGGVAPYRLFNTSPQRLVLNKTTVGNRGESFTVTSNGNCFENLTVVVEDALGKQVLFTFTSEEGS